MGTEGEVFGASGKNEENTWLCLAEVDSDYQTVLTTLRLEGVAKPTVGSLSTIKKVAAAGCQSVLSAEELGKYNDSNTLFPYGRSKSAVEYILDGNQERAQKAQRSTETYGPAREALSRLIKRGDQAYEKLNLK